ncbi:MAG: hypothetical protein AB1896_13665, partial [Thermodesulfobacteriota bacterium]
AVMKEGRKSALRVLPTMEEAIAWSVENGLAETVAEEIVWKKGHRIVTRPGQSIRCESYCAVSGFCNQFQSMQEVAA